MQRSTRAAAFPREARALPTNLLRVVRAPRGVHLEVHHGRRWHRVWTGVLQFADGGDDDEPVLYIDVWPSPTSDSALLRIERDLDPDRRGHHSPYYRTRWIWITLPSSLGARARRVPHDPRRSRSIELQTRAAVVEGAY